MQAMWHCRRSEAPKSQGCAANKKRIKINQNRAHTTSNRSALRAAGRTFNCPDDDHVPDLLNGSSRNKSNKTPSIGAGALTNGEQGVHQYEKKVPIRPCFRAILQRTATVLLTICSSFASQA